MLFFIGTSRASEFEFFTHLQKGQGKDTLGVTLKKDTQITEMPLLGPKETSPRAI